MNRRVNKFRPIRQTRPVRWVSIAGGARTIGVRQRRPVGSVSVSHSTPGLTELTSLAG